MRRALVLFEDRHWDSLRPLTDLVPVPAVRFGASDLGTRLKAASGLPLLAIEARRDVMAAWADAPAAEVAPVGLDEAIVINAAARPGPWLAAALETRAPSLWLGDGRVVGARLPMAQLAGGLTRGEGFEAWLLSLGLPGFAAGAEFITWAWDLIAHNPAAITADLAGEPARREGELHPAAQLLAPERISIAAGARVDALAVLDARGGPIRLERGAIVLPHTVVQGPCVVGAGTELLGGFVGQSSFGPQCRVAGEVDSCVWQGWANKRHHGFVGHSVVGEWVNLGALTTTSDLKNNYGEVRVWVGEREVASGTGKVGSLLGAHVKTGIGTLLPTGAAVGTGANLFGGGRFAPKRTPSFAWWDGAVTVEHELERFLATARTAMSRRGRVMLPAEERLLRAAHAATARERRAGGA